MGERVISFRGSRAWITNSSGGHTLIDNSGSPTRGNYLHFDLQIEEGSDLETYAREKPTTTWSLWCRGKQGAGVRFDLLSPTGTYYLDGINFDFLYEEDCTELYVRFNVGDWNSDTGRYSFETRSSYAPISQPGLPPEKFEVFTPPEARIVFYPAILDPSDEASEANWLETTIHNYDANWTVGRSMPLDIASWRVGQAVVMDTTGVARAQSGRPRVASLALLAYDALNERERPSWNEGLVFHVAVVSPNVTGGLPGGLGRGAVGVPVSSIVWGYDRFFTKGNLEHELGHNLGLEHTYCRGMESDPFLADDYPVATGHLDADGYELGVHRHHFEVIPSNATYDFMSFCTPEWVSAHNYEKMIDFQRSRFSSVSARALAGAPEVVVCPF